MSEERHVDDHDAKWLVADCGRCAGLCCTALPFARSRDFADNKPAGQPCRNLADDFTCRIHDRLATTGWRGCTVFDCAGAGQRVVQLTFGGATWRSRPEITTQMYAVFPVMLSLHEIAVYLTQASAALDALVDPAGSATPEPSTIARSATDSRSTPAPDAHPAPENLPARSELSQLATQVRTTNHAIERRTRSSAADLLRLDLTDLRRDIGELLRLVSTAVRHHANHPLSPAAHRLSNQAPGADLIAATLPGADLQRANLRGAIAIKADLRGADLRYCDLLGADLRDADLRGADLRHALFVTNRTLASARTDAATRRPGWPA